MKRGIFWSVVTGLMLWWGVHDLALIDDPIRSLVAKDPVHHELFRRFEASGLFHQKLHFDVSQLSPLEAEQVTAEMRVLGYDLWQMPQPTMPPAVVPLVRASDIVTAMAPAAMVQRADDLAILIAAVGGTSAVRMDPFGLLPLIKPHDENRTEGLRILSFKAPVLVDYERIGRLRTLIGRWQPRLHAIGSELFAYENYKIISGDISRSLLIAVPLTLAVFLAFCRSMKALIFLVLGSVISYAAGLVAVRFTSTGVYGLVLAFTSTFIGFNNEYLVHLSGLDDARLRRNFKALSSAIGTTAIGFLVLLFAQSDIVRQMAVVALGGMLGFLAFLFSYRGQLAEVRVRQFDLKSITLRPRTLAVIALGLVGIMAALPKPKFQTEVQNFRVQSEFLEAQVRHFESRLSQMGSGRIYAFPLTGSPRAELARINVAMPGVLSQHPLALIPDADVQAQNVAAYRKAYPAARAALTEALAVKGIHLKLPQIPEGIAVADEGAMILWLSSFWPLPIKETVEGKDYLFINVPEGVPLGAFSATALPISPRLYYNALLTDLSQDMARIFLVGLGLMTLYLLPLLRQLPKVLATLTPLLTAALAFQVWLLISHQSLNLIHVMAFALVIALAIDYGAIAVATGFHREELAKVLLAGLMTLASFSALLFAKHPVLSDLGFVVTFCSGIALVVALGLRLKVSEEAGFD